MSFENACSFKWRQFGEHFENELDMNSWRLKSRQFAEHFENELDLNCQNAVVSYEDILENISRIS